MNPDITQLNATITPLRYNQTKGLTGRPSEKIAWATTILAHSDILTAYEKGLQETEKEEHESNQEQPPPPKKTTKGSLQHHHPRAKRKYPPWTGRS